MMRVGPLREGRNPTAWPGLTLVRFSKPGHQVLPFTAGLCVAVQGEKRVYVGDEAFTYGPLQYLIVSLALPLEADITRASAAEPFLGLVLEFDMGLLGQLLIDLDAHEGSRSPDGLLGAELHGMRHHRKNTHRDEAAPCESPHSHRNREKSEAASSPVFVSPMDAELQGALCRLLTAMSDPLDRQALAIGINREILYRLIRGEQGDRLRSLAFEDGAGRRMARIVRYLSEHFSEPIGIEQLAHDWGLSTSALHHSFRNATGMSPLQFLKRTRLHKARALMVEKGLHASSAGYEVGYGSVSQFSREFKRMFGMCPSEVRKQQPLSNPSAPW